ncbi:transposable element Tcb1 transposase [Trichonephila clavipes]|nr:transposable element Tcb1 transposase [Trichonephila clavipes]
MTAQRYVHDILQPHVSPLMKQLTGAIFHQKQCLSLTRQGCHKTVPALLQHFLGLPKFPDLSPVEHIWNHLRQRVGHPTSLNELESRLHQIWNEMSQDIHNLYASIFDCIASCIRATGVEQGIKSRDLLPLSLK